jgi:acetolactate synthase-1/2/3 large subunit
VIALPEDVLTEMATVADAPRYQVVESHPSPSQMAELESLLQGAKKPVALLGGSRWSEEAVQQFVRFAERFELPVACTFRRQMLFPADHASYIGDLGLGVNPKLLARIKEADLILLVGGRLSEVPSQAYTLLDIPAPQQKLVHIHPDASELGRVYSPHLAINASPVAFTAALDGVQPPASLPWGESTKTAHTDYLAWSNPASIRHPGNLQMGEVMAHLRQVMPSDTIYCNGAGNFATWVHRFWPFRHYGTQLAPTSGSMGYGVPAAVGAKRVLPDSTVVVFAGDGDFLMNGQEFATAVQYDLPILIILLDNGMYGTIRMHQERDYPGRVSATLLKNPDFAAYAKAFGGYGERVERTEEFPAALQRALTSSKPAILHCMLDPEAITPTMSLSAIREKALESKR